MPPPENIDWALFTSNCAALCRTTDQFQAVCTLLALGLGSAAAPCPGHKRAKKPRPGPAVAVLVADRGYGKSAALGLAARMLAAAHAASGRPPPNILITGMHRCAVLCTRKAGSGQGVAVVERAQVPDRAGSW